MAARRNTDIYLAGWHLSAIALLLVSMLGFLSCSGGSGEAEDGTTASIAWVMLTDERLSIDDNGDASYILNGRAFASSEYAYADCAGNACLFSLYDDAYPGVSVSWKNLTTSESGSVNTRYGTLTDFAHLWAATVPVVPGINTIEIMASDPGGNVATLSHKIEYIPPAPADLRAESGDGQIALVWTPVKGADGYRVYWSFVPDQPTDAGTPVEVTSSPWVHNGLLNGTTVYYSIVSRYEGEESAPSNEISSIAGAPARPANLVASVVGVDNILEWDAVASADSYNVYWRNGEGVDKSNGTLIPGVTTPFLHTGLVGLPYYYIVSAVNAYGEGWQSDEATNVPQIAPPPPEGFRVEQGDGYPTVFLNWNKVAGVSGYDLYRCYADGSYTPETGCQPVTGSCSSPWEHVAGPITINQHNFWNVEYRAFWYYVTASNAYGESMPSEWSGLCVR